MVQFMGVSQAQKETDSYEFNVSPGTNTLDLGKTYAGNYVSSINGTFYKSEVLDPYVQNITFTAADTRYNALVNITIPKHEGMNGNFSDLRFYSNNKDPLPFYIIDSSSTHANVSIRVNVTNGSNSVTMTFGDPNANHVSNLSSLYLYYYNNSSGQHMNGLITPMYLYSTNIDALLAPSADVNQNVTYYYRNAPSEEPAYIIHSGDGLYAYLNYTSDYQEITSGSNYVDGYTHQINMSVNGDWTTRFDWTTRLEYKKYQGANTTPVETKTLTGNDLRIVSFDGFYIDSTNTSRVFDIRIYNTTSISDVNFGDVISTYSPVVINIPQGQFSTLNYSAENVGYLLLDIFFEPHVFLKTENGTNFSYKGTKLEYESNPVGFVTRYEISTDQTFNQILISGYTSGGNISLKDDRLTEDVYYWRMQNGDGSWTSTRTFEVINDTITLTGHIVDGITGEFVTRNSEFAWKTISTNTLASAVNSTETTSYINNASVIFSQGSTSKTVKFDNENASFVIEDVQLDVPFTIRIQSTTTEFFLNTSYRLTIPTESKKYDLNFSVLRNITLINTSVHGIVTDQYGVPVSNGQVIFYFPNGTIKETVSIQPGGEYGISNTSGEFYVSYIADGFSKREGVIVGPSRQDIILDHLYNITILVMDNSTNTSVNTFSTYLGENQTLQSTDNGTVTYRNVESGQQQVIIQADGYNQVSRGIYVKEDNQTFILRVSKIASGGNQEIVTPFFVTFRIYNQNADLVYNQNVIVKDIDTGVEVFNQTLSGTQAFTVKLDKTARYSLTVIKEASQINKTLNLSGLNDGDTYSVFVNEVFPASKPTIVGSTDVEWDVVPQESGFVYVDVYYKMNFQGSPYITGTVGELHYSSRNGGAKGDIPVYRNSALDNTTYRVRYRMTEGMYESLKQNNTTFSVSQDIYSSHTNPTSQNIYSKYYIGEGQQGLIDLGLDDEQYSYLALQLIIILTLGMATQSNVPMTIQTTCVSALFFMWLGWLVLHPFFQVLLQVGVLLSLLSIATSER